MILTADTELTMIDAMLSAMDGKDPSEAIERQEARGQRTAVREQWLPKHLRGFKREDARQKYEAFGIKVLGVVDDLFFKVELPEGWEIIPEEDSCYWSSLYDASGKAVARFFYKAAFYDRDAFIGFLEDL